MQPTEGRAERGWVQGTQVQWLELQFQQEDWQGIESAESKLPMIPRYFNNQIFADCLLVCSPLRFAGYSSKTNTICILNSNIQWSFFFLQSAHLTV